MLLVTQNLFGVSVSLVFEISTPSVTLILCLLKKDKRFLKDKKTADILNSYLDLLIDALDLFSCSTQIDYKKA